MSEREILLTAILKCQRADLYAGKLALTKEQEERLAYCLSLRAKGEPLQYILGETEFFGLKFKVDSQVLIPRPETEILVETVIRMMKDAGRGTQDEARILDIGTGSGCIAVSLAKSLSNARVTAVDISPGALELARENASLNGVSGKIDFICSDQLSAVSLQLSAFDVIVSNPPYICSKEIEKLSVEVRNEPRLALDGGNDGLDFYRGIIPRVGGFLKKGAFLVLEMGFPQRQGIEEIVNQQGRLRVKEVIKDYSDLERVMVLSNG